MTEIDWGDRSARVQWASGITPKKQTWLLDNRIPVGTVSGWAGRGGTGKTTYILGMIAKLTKGTLPGKFHGTPQTALIWSGEDAWDTVLVPRLIAAGADLDKVGRLYIADARLGTGETAPKLPLDTDRIEKAVIEAGAVLILIDPIASTMSGDLHREADVRLAVDALARVAEKTGSVVMFVRHFGKGGGNASDKMSGSHAFRDAVRSVFLFAEDGDRVIVTQDKGNYAPKGDESFAFRLETFTVTTVDGDTEVARVVDLGTSEVSVSDVINRTADVGNDDDSTDVDEWLSELLKDGPVESAEVYKAADAAGLSKDKAKRAKKRLGVKAHKPGGPGKPWLWELSKGAIKGSNQREHEENREPAPFDPPSSESVNSQQDGQREQLSGACSLNPAKPSVMSAKGNPPALITSRRHRQRTIGGQPTANCPHCGDPLTYSDDRRDGYHTSKAACVKAQQTRGRAS
ncbi:MAG: AAA family ATPase [Mycobacterium sp.]|jgi:hypothetical protein|nr:MAG: AAA family ATPase [Mycobacterium sp.]